MKKTENLFENLKKQVLDQKPNTPRQEVKPVKEVIEEEEPYTLWMGKTRKLNLKMMSVSDGDTIKNLINKAVGAMYPGIDKKEKRG